MTAGSRKQLQTRDTTAVTPSSARTMIPPTAAALDGAFKASSQLRFRLSPDSLPRNLTPAHPSQHSGLQINTGRH